MTQYIDQNVINYGELDQKGEVTGGEFPIRSINVALSIHNIPPNVLAINSTAAYLNISGVEQTGVTENTTFTNSAVWFQLNDGGSSLTPEQAAEIAANTNKVGITAQQTLDIIANNLKVTYPTTASDKLATISDTWVSEETYALAEQVWYLKKLYISKTSHTGITTVPSSDTTNWSPAGTGSGGGGGGDITVNGSVVTGILTGTNLGATVTDGVATINAAGGGGGSYNTTDLIKTLLLGPAFVKLTEGVEVSGVTPYTGSLAGEAATTYYFKSSDDSWYSDSATTTKIIGF